MARFELVAVVSLLDMSAGGPLWEAFQTSKSA
jgi:hypothetical protein